MTMHIDDSHVSSRRGPLERPGRRLENYAPLRAFSIKVTELASDWRRLRIKLPLNCHNRNPGGSMFGGAVAALADPIAPLSLNRCFPGNRVWTRAMHLDFRHEARSDLELRYELPTATEIAIRTELTACGRATPSLEFGFYDTRERLCVWVRNTVAIRPADYRPGRPEEPSND